ncbi:MAG: hypothetical protein LC687_06760 [Actinobacteria bacterium]|nr:hypothetical protein [Actinomycetota bacterium]
MILGVYLLLLALSLLAVVYGQKFDHMEMTLVGFTFLFLLGITLAGASAVVGGTGGVELPTGTNITFTYNDTVPNSDSTLLSELRADTYTTYSNWFFGAWLAIMSFFGFFGAVVGRGIWQ